MNDSVEHVVSTHPFTVRRRIRWGDCDPAGVVYTGRFVEYLLGAVDLFSRHAFGGLRSAFVNGLGVDTPCKGLSLDFHVALAPDARDLLEDLGV